ncbi:PREDICTED: jmjC domain-containing protein 4-like isoform X1 [Branchiostoma belcheri]|uniref:2-oxoglutarate and iron-dependent oxygenase JMJD4 n=1 Tax=Branchiostoma belcheri TaxID=7741 RepID=A0A6P4Y7A8_BRABE|nr:PREDICTED: jmjC domain-containing protein 4-like isoform X1 [Branchiostoma belcheri]XP_019624930.1 PREDICTED: jmjC domain-containing protein 4-like isoform X1 [Branchiostoma belcheri]XP_019624932.1 PREDICTED: jmjC domain-containing protein 4-like isoform X1 [Branchiostoma belcheri]XP_019624933.1 PREDICTED: jmjC domain-containing protein 4-like isoform X1 [Branchiostoma belcheri]
MEGQEGPVLDETVLDPVLLPRQKEASSCCQIDFISQPITYQEFFLLYLQPNRPCLFGGHITSQWRCRREWVSKDGKPNWNALKQLFGKLTVPVADCKRVEFQAQPKCDMILAEFLDYWQDLYTSEHTPGKPCLYLKDWHFCRACPDYGAYETPVFFQSDWLNEFWDLRYRGADDYRFVYMGPKGSWTPLHADVFHSYSWSANICGRKQWLFFPPGQEEQLRDTTGSLVYDVRSEELLNSKRYPHYHKDTRPMEVIQGPGEVVFVPSGWHHQVYNMEDTISINHNWVNCCNVHMMWSFLQAELCRVQQAISDCTDMEDWHGHCQVMLKASSGINYEEFVDFLVCIAERRLHDLQVWDQDGSRHHHHRLDLRTLSSLLSVIMADQHFTLMAAAVQAQVGSLKQTLDKVNP